MERQVIHDAVAGVTAVVETGYLGTDELKANVRLEGMGPAGEDISIGGAFDLHGTSALIHALVKAHGELKAEEPEQPADPEHGSAFATALEKGGPL